MENINNSDLEILFNFFNQVYPISQKEFDLVAQVTMKKSYKKGDYILNLNQIETKTSFVLSGTVHQYVIIEGDIFTIDITLPGMSFNCFTSFIDKTPSNQIQLAITDVQVLYIEKEDSEKLLIESFPFCYIYTKLYEQVHLEREKRSLILQHKNAFKRFELFLSTITKSQLFIKEVPQKLIANYLSLSPETYSRVKKEYYKTLKKQIC
jgi:CRP/FNR family transcriptional regulator, anaerobic regulatory protein